MDLLNLKLRALKDLGATEEYIKEIHSIVEQDKELLLESYISELKKELGINPFPSKDHDMVNRFDLINAINKARENHGTK